MRPDLASEILNAATPKHYSDCQRIYGFEEKHGKLFGIASGVVRMSVSLNEMIPRLGHIAGPGFWFGEGELLTGQGSIMEMEASGEVVVYAIDRPAISKLAAYDPEVWRAIALLAVMNMGTAIGAADDLLIRASRSRLAAVLLRLGSLRHAFQGVPPLETLPITRASLADVANLSESLTYALLSELETAGLIQRQYAAIKLLNPRGLFDMMK